MDKLWIVSADESRGRIFRTDKASGKLEEYKDLIHPQARSAEADLASRLRGSNSSTGNYKAHSLNDSGSIKDHHADMFAKEVAGMLVDGKHKNMFANLVLVAPPKFLGLLRKNLDKSTSEKVCYELNKDLSKLGAAELRSCLPKRLPLVT